uniref:Uncharacterized protein n=1 Tax=Anguilla anguilla TaxID=7936 RepID=A0A0E9THL1_ANGAN
MDSTVLPVPGRGSPQPDQGSVCCAQRSWRTGS